MSGDIVLAGLAANDPTPNPAFIEIDFAQGDAAGSDSPLEAILIGNAATAGSATRDTVVYGPDSLVQLQTEADAIALFGDGSELHRMWRRFTAVNKTTTLRAIAVTESVGTAPTGTFTITSTATANGALRVWVGDEFVDTSITNGDTNDVIGANAAASINTQTHWAVTAAYSAVSHTMTLTAKQKGPRGNDIRFMTAIVGTGVTTTTSVTADTALTTGATADDLTAALATLSPDRYYYIVLAENDSTQIGKAVTQINSQATATTGIRQRLFAGCTDTLANAITLATSQNAARLEIVWQKSSDWTPAELAANHAAVMSLFEVKPNPRTNFCNFGLRAPDQPYWLVPPARTASARPTYADIKSALNNGLSPLGVIKKSNTTFLVNRITTRSLNGSQNDYRIRAAHKVTICDFFGDDLAAVVTARFADKKMGDDVPQGTPPLGPDFVTPDRMRGTVGGVISTYDSNGLWQPGGAGRMKTSMAVQRATTPRTRMGVRISAEPVDNYEQGAFQILQTA